MTLLATLVASTWLFAQGGAATGPPTFTNEYVTVQFTPDDSTIDRFRFVTSEHNLAGAGGLLQEGFGVGSYYVPNRRLNVQSGVLNDTPGRPVVRLVYDCDGPNIAGLRVTRVVEPVGGEPSLRVRWSIENKGTEAQWVAPWVRVAAAPGGTVDAGDRIDMPTFDGIVQPQTTQYAPAARNWIAVTDPAAKETVYAVFNADDVFALHAIREIGDGVLGMGAVFVPFRLAPGERWETLYRVNAVRGLDHVDFAADSVAAQLDHELGELQLLMSAAHSYANAEIHGAILGPDDTNWPLSPKIFSMAPDRLVRCTYAWGAPTRGAYEFLAEIRKGGESLPLSVDTAPPHGGIDTVFVAGEAAAVHFEAWTDAPYRLQRGSRTLKRALASTGAIQVWIESPLTKLFPDDRVEAAGPNDPTAKLLMARNEAESFQVAFRTAGGSSALYQLRVNELRNETGDAIAAGNITIQQVGFVPVIVPTHFESATGLVPDPLRATAIVEAAADATSAVWVTVYAPEGTPPGVYRGTLGFDSVEGDPLEVFVEATVLPITLPKRPSLKTDMGVDRTSVLAAAKARGFDGDAAALDGQLRASSLAHRVTLRELSQLPAEAPDYEQALKSFGARLNDPAWANATTLFVPPSLLSVPEQLRMAESFVKTNRLEDRAFTQLAAHPGKPAWSRVLEAVDTWRGAAPDIPVMVTTMGLEPFLAESVKIWGLHSQAMDSPAGKTVLDYIHDGHEVWWYVNHAPPRPYANLFTDFAAIEHRILFWQAWALGVKGFHYWSVNDGWGDDPYNGALDSTPVNGNGVLLYPSAKGIESSIRWETIRDGIEDYDYLVMLMDRVRAVKARGNSGAILDRVAGAYNLQQVIPNLLTFTRDPAVLESKRGEIARAIVELDQALER